MEAHTKECNTAEGVNRRTLIRRAGVVAAGAAVVGPLSTPDSADATGSAIIAGSPNSAPGTTQLTSPLADTSFWAVRGAASGIPLNAALAGDSKTSGGVGGITTANDGVGVVGISGAKSGTANSVTTGVWGDVAQGTGVYGTVGGNGTMGGLSKGVWGVAAGAAYGVEGDADSGFGVVGTSNSGAGVVGVSATSIGLQGTSTSSYGVTGTAGTSSGASAAVSGVWGDSAAGTGVAGTSKSSNGVYGAATATGGVGGSFAGTGGATALRVTGTSVFSGSTAFSRSGVLTVPSGSKTATKTGIGLGASSIVMATIQDSTSNSIAGVVRNVSAKTFTVNLVNNTSADTVVAWLIIN